MSKSDRTLRNLPRVEYKVLAESGKKVFVESVNVQNKVSMANIKLAKMVAEIEAMFFQMTEIDDTFEDVATMSPKEVVKLHDELKELRVNMVRSNSELNQSKGEDSNIDYEKKVQHILGHSKGILKHLKMIISKTESNQEKVEIEKERLLKEEKEAEEKSKLLAFQRSVKDVERMYATLNYTYNELDNFSRSEMLKRNDDKAALASEFDKIRDRVNKLINRTDINFENKENILDHLLELVCKLEFSKQQYEKKVYDDLVANELTEEKMKLAEATKIEIGKFSGCLGTGDDFYTFKSKFMKAYGNHPKSLLVEWLKNNHLEGQAKDCVGSLLDIENIWKRLQDNFGNTEQMLMYHFSKINKMGSMFKQKSFTAKKHYVQSLINAMQDVLDLATEHDLVGELHYGPQLGKIVGLLENYLQTGWYKIITVENTTKTKRWLRMVIYLEAQLSIIQTRAFEVESAEFQTSHDMKNDRFEKPSYRLEKKGTINSVNLVNDQCNLCDEKHPNANKEFTLCRKFLLMSPKKRCEHVRKKKLCLQCLDGKTKWNDSEHKCSNKWTCQHDSHEKYDKKLHFLVCEYHTSDEQYKRLFEDFKKEVLKAEWQQKLFRNASGYLSRDSAFVKRKSVKNDKSSDHDNGLLDATSFGTPVFLLQPVPFNNHVFNFMFDTGCENFVCRKGALDFLPDDCKENIIKGPIIIRGVGCNKVTSPHGHYSVKLPIHDGRSAKFNGICLDVITGAIPPFPVREANKSIIKEYKAQGGNEKDLPEVPVLVGGETDFLFGVQYNFYLPRLVFILPSGLAIYESMFAGLDGSRGCIGGPHELFMQCEKQFLESNTVAQFNVYLQEQLKLFNSGIKVCVDCDSLTTKNCLNPHQIAIVNEDDVNDSPVVLLSSKKKLFSDADDAGSVIEYRCIKCRGCSDCKNGEVIEKVSLREEYEQHLIDSSVTVDFEKGETVASLPFVSDPALKLVTNKDIALKIYNQQIKKLSKNASVKEAVLESELKLQKDGHVEWLKNLDPEEQKMLGSFMSKYYMPWRFVHNENSITTPVRIVFDASSITKSGYSLNDILAKGINSMNSLLEIFIRFRTSIVAIHTDIKKMYNVVKLKPEHWNYQRYLWRNNLNPSKPPKEKIIKTAIYGVKSSGNQAERGLRDTAERQKDMYPAAANSILKDTYVDDCATGANSVAEGEQLASDIDEVLAKGGFTTKGFTMSGRPPLPTLTKDEVSISVIGIKWYSESDKIQLSAGPLNFAKKQRGKRPVNDDSWKIPDKLTKRICVSKVAELFDLGGLVTPIMAGFKLDLRNLILTGCDWDDKIPDVYRDVWIKNFQLMERIGDVKYSRAVVPEDAESLTMELIGAGDASAKMACAGCYVRFKRKNGHYSCQLILSKSKIVPEGMSVPRAELYAATLNAHVTEIVKRALMGRYGDYILVLDSEVALHWLSSQTKQLKPWVRNRVIEINRFTKCEDWYHLESSMNPVDLGTRKGATLEDVNADSEWINGKPWMVLPLDEIKTSYLRNINGVKCRSEQMIQIEKETMKSADGLCNSDFHLLMTETNEVKKSECYTVDICKNGMESDISTKVRDRLQFSKYLIDPNKFNFDKVVRILALVIKLAKYWLLKCKARKKLMQYSYSAILTDKMIAKQLMLKKSVCVAKQDLHGVPNNDFIMLSDDEIQYSLDYFFQKASDEVKSFVHPKYYESNSFEKNGILYYSGRVLQESISFKCNMTEAMIDLSTGSFIVPIVERYSPLAFSIVNQIHWYHPTAKHSGVETTIRFIMNIAHILGVRDLVKLFRRQCVCCRYLLKRTVDVEMAPASKHQMCVAPPYYVTQVDLCGPFSAYSKHNKRTTLKIWIITFVCSTTGMTNLKVMEGYDTTQFLLAFSRFACEVGFPKVLLPDAGGQLINGCETMVISMCDLKGILNREFGIEFKTCPVGGHNFHGKVERKIRTVQETINKTIHNARLSTLEWETLCAEIANSINNLPVAIGNETVDLENLDLITPNRLRLGRNNDRSPVGVLDVTDKVDRILRMNSNIFNTWWEMWLISALPKLVAKPKWFKNDEHIKKGDIVLFNKSEGSFVGNYKYGIVEAVQYGADNRIRAVTVRYRNANEEIDRTTFRAVRSLVIIHRIDEINVMEELGKASLLAVDTVSSR